MSYVHLILVGFTYVVSLWLQSYVIILSEVLFDCSNVTYFLNWGFHFCTIWDVFGNWVVVSLEFFYVWLCYLIFNEIVCILQILNLLVFYSEYAFGLFLLQKTKNWRHFFFLFIVVGNSFSIFFCQKWYFILTHSSFIKIQHSQIFNNFELCVSVVQNYCQF